MKYEGNYKIWRTGSGGSVSPLRGVQRQVLPDGAARAELEEVLLLSVLVDVVRAEVHGQLLPEVRQLHRLHTYERGGRHA